MGKGESKSIGLIITKLAAGRNGGGEKGGNFGEISPASPLRPLWGGHGRTPPRRRRKEADMARILVVDDEKVMVKGIRFNLENEGYTVDVGYNGRQAVYLAREMCIRDSPGPAHRARPGRQ